MSDQNKVAVIGLGNIGRIVADNLVRGNRKIIVADRNLEKSAAIASTIGGGAVAMEISEAIRAADLILFAVYFNSIKELFAGYQKELEGKILIDPSNPIAPDGNGGFKKIIGEKESAGEILLGQLPKGATLVKAFGTLTAASLKDAAFAEPRKVLFYAANESGVTPVIDLLISDSGFAPIEAGDLSQSIRLEAFGDLHEIGALGKPVTVAEAQKIK